MKISNYNPYQVHPITNLIGGLNDQMDPSEIGDQEMADCENYSIEEGVVLSAPGYVGWDDTANPGPYWGGFCFKKADGYMVNIRQRRDTLEYALYGDSVWLPCTMPTTGSPASTLTLTQCQPTFASLNDICIFTNGFENVLSSTDGITWTIRAALPKSKVVFENAKNRVLYLNQTGTNRQFRFDWSNINDPLTIGASSYQLVDPNNNGIVIGAGLTPDGTTLIMKENAVYTIADFVDNGIIDINFIAQAACANHQTICTTKNSVIWCGWPGMQINEYIGGTVRNISGRIKNIGRNDGAQYLLYCAAYYNNKYRISVQDSTESYDYNSQEYVFYLNLLRNDAVQPYAVTRNKRHIGCYFIEDYYFDYGRDVTLYIGDSRPLTTAGSPAQYTNTLFAWVNDFRDPIYSSGLDGASQPAYFVTKYFTENASYYAKKFKKFFTNLKVEQDLVVTIGYRFQPYGAWNEQTVTFTAGTLDFTEGFGFLEGFGFAWSTSGQAYLDIENIERPRGIQFKVSTDEVNDVRFLDFAYTFLVKTKFH